MSRCRTGVFASVKPTDPNPSQPITRRGSSCPAFDDNGTEAQRASARHGTIHENPKSEIRNPKQIPNPKLQCSKLARPTTFEHGLFKLRVCFGFRVLGFGFFFIYD